MKHIIQLLINLTVSLTILVLIVFNILALSENPIVHAKLFGSTRDTIKNDIDNALETHIPTEFVVIQNRNELDISNISVTYKIYFSKRTFETVLSQIDLNNWENTGSNHYLFNGKTRPRAHLVLTLDTRQRTLKYWYFM